jgi:hypothetical protein
LLEIARREFPTFYGRGSLREQNIMDLMVVLTSVVVTFSAPRAGVPVDPALAESSDAAYRTLGELIDGVRRSPTFALLPMVERMKIESAIFERATRARQL